jgi:thioredoxin 1
MIKPILEALSQEMADKVQFFAVNVDDEYQLADQYDIEAVPTLILFKDGQEVDRQEGALSKPALKSWIESQTI